MSNQLIHQQAAEQHLDVAKSLYFEALEEGPTFASKDKVEEAEWQLKFAQVHATLATVTK